MPTPFKTVLDPISRTLDRSPLGRLRLGLKLLAFLLVVLVLLPTTITYVNPGYVGIVIHRAGGGVDKKPLGPGLHLQKSADDGNRGISGVHADVGAGEARRTKARATTTRSTSTARKVSRSRSTSR